jgi:hypothetical protein
MGDLTYRYVEGLQWVMHYYYSGVASWGWFYDYHFTPRISGMSTLSFSRFLRLIDSSARSEMIGEHHLPFRAGKAIQTV